MEKKDKITLIVFIFLIVSIITVVSINSYKNKKLTDVDRKIEYIMGYSYDAIINKGSSLFTETIKLLNDKNAFEYSKNIDGSVTHYAINDDNNYIKITNFSLAINNFSSKALEEYMNYKNIIYFENDYYMLDEKILGNNYVGSMIELDSYSDNSVTFSSVNYYCANSSYLGLLDTVPSCDYTVLDTKFTMILENNLFKIDTIKDFEFINN